MPEIQKRFLRLIVDGSHTLNFLIIISFLLSIPLALGFSVFPTVIFAGFFLLNTICGAYLYIRLSRKSEFHFIELFALGIGLGTSIPAAVNFSIRLVGVEYGTTALIFPIIICMWIPISRKLANPKIFQVKEAHPIDICIVLSSGTVALASWVNEFSIFLICELFVLAILFHL